MKSAPHPHLVQRALSYATRAHQGQLRRDGFTPYIAHPMRVLYTLSHVFGFDAPEMLAAAALHDVIEDCPIDRDEIAEQFGSRVADLVVLLSKDDRLSQPERDDRYYADLAAADWQARALKFADAYDNLLDSADLPDGPRPKRLKVARRCLDELSGKQEKKLKPAIEALRVLLQNFET